MSQMPSTMPTYNPTFVAGGYLPATPAGQAAGAAAANAAKGGSMITLGGFLLASIAGAAIGGIFDAWQGHENRSQQQKMFNSQMAFDKEKLEYQKGVDRFNMNMATRQQNETERLNQFNITQVMADRLNATLRNNSEMQSMVAAKWGGMSIGQTGGQAA